MLLNEEEIDQFTSVVRSSSEQILNEHELVSSHKFFAEIFGAITGIGAIMNRSRQIVYVNGDFLKMLGLEGIESVLGNKLGEVLSCVHSREGAGCGTNAACNFCGARNAIIQSQKTGQKTVKEAFITTRSKGMFRSLDMNITISPFVLSGHTFYLIMLQDISSEKRRAALEKIFFHDLLNSAGGLNGLLSLLREGVAPGIEKHLIELSEEASRDIIEEIQLQRQIYAAEKGDLAISLERINSITTVNTVIGKIGFHESGRDKKILVTAGTADVDFETDSAIFQRVLINLLKNALEATSQGGTVWIGAQETQEQIIFRVKNDLVIPPDVQMQLFQRSFTTKGTGRGLGTYSIRLLTENYLKGHVSFISNKEEGTIFRVDLQKKFPSACSDK